MKAIAMSFIGSMVVMMVASIAIGLLLLQPIADEAKTVYDNLSVLSAIGNIILYTTIGSLAFYGALSLQKKINK